MYQKSLKLTASEIKLVLQNESLSSTLHETKRAFIREQEAKAREFDEKDRARQAHIAELEKNLKVHHPGVNLRANHKSISHRCHLFEVEFEWDLTKATIHLPLGCLHGGNPTRFREAREFDEKDRARQAHIAELEKNLKVQNPTRFPLPS